MKVGITFSAFDLLHAGHIGMLREARANCDYLIVGLQTDPTIDRPRKAWMGEECNSGGRIVDRGGRAWINRRAPPTWQSLLPWR